MTIWPKLTFARWPLEGLKVLKIDKLTLICNRETQSDQGKNAFERPILAYIYLGILPIKWPKKSQKLTFARWPLKALKMHNIDLLTPIYNRETRSDQGKEAIYRLILSIFSRACLGFYPE